MVATITNSPSISVCKRKEPWFLRKEATTARKKNGAQDTTMHKSNGPIEPQLNREDNNIILTLKRQFIMTKETKENVQIVSAIAMLIGGFLLAVAGFIVPPTGQIHESVLGVFAECLIYAGSIFGVTIYIQTKYAELRSYLDDKLKRKEEKDAQD